MGSRTPCWRSECRNGCYYPDACDFRPEPPVTADHTPERLSEEPDPIGDIAERFQTLHGCDDARACEECRKTAELLWQYSPGHRQAWEDKQQRALAEAVKDVCWRAQQYGETEDGDTFAYLVTKGAMHRLIGAAQGAGIPAAFRADSSKTLADQERTSG